ncbi:MAG: FAD-binding protein [Gammaproteobacteria bacterium]|nr:FAD-binding protein [Gammaproteobacteria bacterium]
MSTLVIAEHNGIKLSNTVTQSISAAVTWGDTIDVLLVGDQLGLLSVEVSNIKGVRRVLKAEAPHLTSFIAEDISNIILSIAHQYDVILAAHSSFSLDFLPRAAAQLDVAMISDVLSIPDRNTYTRSIYAGSIQTTILSSNSKEVITIRASNFTHAELGNNAEIFNIDVPQETHCVKWLGETRIESELPELTSAKIVVSGGRSLGSADKFDSLLRPLANKLGAALGATRAAVDAGYAPNEIQIGQTGVTVAPELYIAVGISGAVQHTSGMKDSRVVVAINADPDAPIFQVSDYVLISDLFNVVPELVQTI